MAIEPIEIEFLMKDNLTSGVQKATQASEGLERTASGMSEKIKAQIKEQKALIKTIEGDIRSLEQRMKKAMPGAQKNELAEYLHGARTALLDAKGDLAGLEQAYDETATSASKLIKEQRQLIASMAEMRLAGKQNSEAYRLLAERAAELTDTLGDVRAEANALAHDQSGLQGVISGLSGLAGGFTAATGVMSLFFKENEDLIAIQTKLQSVMAITLGIQQLMDALNADSAFRLVAVKKIKTMLIGVYHSLTRAMWGSTMAAKAFMATITLGISVAITAAIVAYNKYADAQEEARQKALEQVEIEKDARAETLRKRVELERTISSLKNFNGTQKEAKKQVAELNQKYGEAFGYYKTQAEWYDALTKRSEAYLKTIFLEAKARSLLNKAVEADEELNKVKASDPDDHTAWYEIFTDEDEAKQKAVAAAEKKKQAYLQDYATAMKELEKILKESFIGGHEDPQKVETNQGPSRQAEDRAHLSKSLAEKERSALRNIQEMRVASLAEGYARERQEAALNHQREMERIKKEETERLELIARLRKSGARVSPEQESKTRALARTEEALAEETYSANLRAIDRREVQEREEKLNELLSRYADFDEQRRQAEEEHHRVVMELSQLMTTENSARINAALDEADRQHQERLKAIGSAELEASKETTNALVSLFEDASEKSLAEINRIIDESEQLFDYLKTTSAEEITEQFGISAGRLKLMKQNPQELESLSNAIKALKREVAGRGSFSAFFAELRRGIEAIKQGDKGGLGKGIELIGKSVKDVMPQIQELGKTIFSALGQEAGDGAESLSALIGGIGSAAMGVGQFMSGDVMGGVQSMASGVASIVALSGKAAEAHKKALEAIREAQLEFEREYLLLLLKQQLAFEQATTPFGEQKALKAANALRVYSEALEHYATAIRGVKPVEFHWRRKKALETTDDWLEEMVQGERSYKQHLEAWKKGYGALGEARIVTGHRKTGLFGWGSGADVYDSLLSVYPEIIKASGELDIEMLKVIIAKRKMSDEHKNMLENIVKQEELMREARGQFDSYIQDTFGSLGSSITKALAAHLSEGKDALRLFADDAANVLENLGEQIAYSLFFADRFKELQSQLKEAYLGAKNDEGIAQEAQRLIGDFYRNIGKEMEAAKAWTEHYKKEAAEAGFNLWTSGGASQSARAGAFTAMSQEQGTKLEGLFTSGQVHWANMDDSLQSITATLSGALAVFSKIEANTAPIAEIYEQITLIKRDGIKIK